MRAYCLISIYLRITYSRLVAADPVPRSTAYNQITSTTKHVTSPASDSTAQATTRYGGTDWWDLLSIVDTSAKKFKHYGKRRLQPRYSAFPPPPSPPLPFPLPFPSPPPGPMLKDNSMCVFLGAALGICNSLTYGFSTLNPTVQADCLCYSSTLWAPGIFDGAVGQCAGFASTAVPSAYAPLANLEGFCESIGDFKEPKSTSVTTTTTTEVLASPTNTGCVAIMSAIDNCVVKTPGFGSMAQSEQAKCLCYDSNRSWAPTNFDNAIRTCGEYYSTAGGDKSALSPTVTSLAGLCASAGNVLGSSLSTPAFTLPSITSMAPPPSASGLFTTTNAESTELDTTIDTTITIRATRTPVPIESNRATLRKVKPVEVVGISFCCALVLLFL